jgi:hypothetical protein
MPPKGTNPLAKKKRELNTSTSMISLESSLSQKYTMKTTNRNRESGMHIWKTIGSNLTKVQQKYAMSIGIMSIMNIILS